MQITFKVSCHKWCALLFFCQFLSIQSLSAQENPNPADSVPMYAEQVPGPNLPPVGRSYFDHLIYEQSTSGQMPDTFEELLNLMKQHSSAVPAILIPRGRSLQKEAAAPDYFKFPRIVAVSTTSNEVFTNPKLRVFDPDRKLFVGYSEIAKQLEVISYNEQAARYEFQVVKNFGPGLKPNIFYADRGLCTSCHQHQAGLFIDAPWTETNNNFKISRAIARVLGQTSYHGVDVVRPLQAAPAFVIQQTTEISTIVRRVGDYWKTVCATGPEGGIPCRVSLLKIGLNVFQNNYALKMDRDRASDVVIKKFCSDFNGLCRVPNPTLITLGAMDLPFEDQLNAGAKESVASLADFNDINNDVMQIDFSREQNPLTIRSADYLIAYDDLNRAFFSPEDFTAILKVVGNDRARVDEAIARLVAKTRSGESQAFATAYPSRDAVIGGLMRELGVPTPHLCCDIETKPFPEAQLEPSSVGVEPGENPNLHYFKTYCAACHEAAVTPSFMAGDNAAIESQIRELAPKMIERLDWFGPQTVSGNISPMPPKASRFYKKLALPENSQDRQAMIIFLKKIVDEKMSGK